VQSVKNIENLKTAVTTCRDIVCIRPRITNKTFPYIFSAVNYFNRVRTMISSHFNIILFDANKYNTIELFCSRFLRKETRDDCLLGEESRFIS